MKREDQRVIFRELHPRGWTAVDDIDEITPGTRRPTLPHGHARLEIQNLLGPSCWAAPDQVQQ
jgi:chromosome partitioning protein